LQFLLSERIVSQQSVSVIHHVHNTPVLRSIYSQQSWRRREWYRPILTQTHYLYRVGNSAFHIVGILQFNQRLHAKKIVVQFNRVCTCCNCGVCPLHSPVVDSTV